MSTSRVVQSVVSAGVFLLMGVVPAMAAWPFSEASQVACGYGETYADADGASITHTGVDIAADEGSSVLAVQAGRVTFAGRVPAAGGGSVLAITVETAAGERWTYLPLATLGVASGYTVECGAPLGPLAPSGDRSTPASHLHLSLRRGERYIDPMPFISFAQKVPETSAVSGEARVSVAPAQPASPVVGGVVLSSAAPAPTSITAPSSSPVPVVSGVSAPAQSQSLQPVIRVAGEAPARSAAACAREAEQSRSRLMRANTSAPAGSVVDVRVDAPLPAALAGGAAPRPALPFPTFGLGLGLLFLPAVWLAINRSLSSRVTAPGDTVAAAVGR